MERETSAALVALEEQLCNEGVPADDASDFIDKLEDDIELLLERQEVNEKVTEGDNENRDRDYRSKP